MATILSKSDIAQVCLKDFDCSDIVFYSCCLCFWVQTIFGFLPRKAEQMERPGNTVAHT